MKILLAILIISLIHVVSSSYLKLNDVIDTVNMFKNDISEIDRRNLVASLIDVAQRIQRNYSTPLQVALDKEFEMTFNVDVSMHVEVVFQEIRELILERRGDFESRETEHILVRGIHDFLSREREKRSITHITNPSVNIASPVATKRYPKSARVYFEFEQSRTTERITCVHFDRGSEAIQCVRLPQTGPLFISEHTISVGAHVLELYGKQNHDLESKGTLLSTSHFYVSNPQVSIEVNRFSSDVAIVQVSLFEFCNQKNGDGDLNILMDGHIVKLPPFDEKCSMLPLESQSSCFVLQNVPPGPHEFRALLVTNNSKAVSATPAYILTDTNDPKASTPEGGCVPILWPDESQGKMMMRKEKMLNHLRLLPKHEWGLRSQNGEDGILMWLLRTSLYNNSSLNV